MSWKVLKPSNKRIKTLGIRLVIPVTVNCGRYKYHRNVVVSNISRTNEK